MRSRFAAVRMSIVGMVFGGHIVAAGAGAPGMVPAGAWASTVADEQNKNVLTIERIFGSPSLTGRAPRSIRWMADSRGITYLVTEGEDDLEQTYLVKVDVPSGKRRTLCIADTVTVPEDLDEDGETKFKIGSYRWAEEGDLMAFRFKGDIFTFDAKTAEIVRRTQSDVAEANVAFSPDGQKLAFTREHDMWMIDLDSGDETQITTTGSDSLLNGVLDWVYMEELFTRGNVKGYWWSPDSKSIVYLQIDESPVQEFPIVDFVPVYNTADMQHYPKAGSDNPIVRLGVRRLDDAATVWLDVDTTDDSYIARVYWLGDSKRVAIEKLNRNQDHLDLLFADTSSGEVTTVLEENKPTWINVTYAKHYYETKDRFVWNSDRDGNSHLYLYKNNGGLVTVTDSLCVRCVREGRHRPRYAVSARARGLRHRCC